VTTFGLDPALATFAEARWLFRAAGGFRARRKVWGGTGIVAYNHEQLEL
jgi:hypothetical protein